MNTTKYGHRVYSLQEDANDSENISESANDTIMSDEKLNIEALKIGINVAKLMSDVTPDDIVNISSQIATFIRKHEIGSGSTSSNENADENEGENDSTEDFSL